MPAEQPSIAMKRSILAFDRQELRDQKSTYTYVERLTNGIGLVDCSLISECETFNNDKRRYSENLCLGKSDEVLY